MALRFYILPLLETNVNGSIYRAAKYMGGNKQPPPLSGLEGISFSIMDYGFEPICIMGAEVTTSQNTILSSQSDVMTVPANINTNLNTTAVNAAQNFLENLKIPANWITTSLTYKDVLHQVCWLFQFMQRLHGIHPTKLFQPGVNLSTTFSELDASTQQALLDTGISFGFDVSGVTASTTLRQILKGLANNFGNLPIDFAGIVL